MIIIKGQMSFDGKDLTFDYNQKTALSKLN